MKRVSRDLHRRKKRKIFKKLFDILSVVGDEEFLQLIWAVDVLQSKRGTDVSKYLVYPEGAATLELSSRYFAHKWDLETLVLLLLTTSKRQFKLGQDLGFDCKQFRTMSRAINLLRSLESSESALIIDNSSIMLEMYRIGQRQFGWQRGFASSEKLYRYAFVYGQGACAEHFLKTNGFTIEKFMHASFILFVRLHGVPWTKIPKTEKLGLDSKVVEQALGLLSRPLLETREIAANLIEGKSGNAPRRTAYLPSVLRRFPIVSSPVYQTIISPLPDLIIYRATAGLYFDILAGPQSLLEEANKRFEEYTRLVIANFCPQFDSCPSEKFGPKKRQLETPDVLVKFEGELSIVIECKATKLTFDAQFAVDPFEDAQSAFNQIVKGVAQLWKFFSSARRGVYKTPVSENVHAVILTMEPWGQMANELQCEIVKQAKEFLSDEHDVIDADMRIVTFCSIQELVDILAISDEELFLSTLRHAELPKYAGWGLESVRRELGGKKRFKKFPFDIVELLPWWGNYKG